MTIPFQGCSFGRGQAIVGVGNTVDNAGMRYKCALEGSTMKAACIGEWDFSKNCLIEKYVFKETFLRTPRLHLAPDKHKVHAVIGYINTHSSP